MKKILFAVSLLPLVAFSWPVDQIEAKIGKITYAEEPGGCSAVAINSPKNIWFTVIHCLGESQMYINSLHAVRVVEKDMAPGGDGIAVLKGDERTGVHQPVFTLAPMPKRGDPLLLQGMNGVSPRTFFFEALYLEHLSFKDDGDYLYASNGLIGGMSGGPIVDKRGRLVSLGMGNHVFPDYGQAVAFGIPWNRLKTMYEKWK